MAIKLMKETLLFLSFVAFFSESIAQTRYSINYSINEGLLSNEVYDIHQDSKGFLWFATDYGVNRFDGRSMASFTVKEGLRDEDILQIDEDHQKRIWFLSYNGKLSYSRDGIIYNSSKEPFLKQLNAKQAFISFAKDQYGTCYFGTNGDGVLKVDTLDSVRQVSTLKDTNSDSHYIFEREGQLYSCSRTAIVKIAKDLDQVFYSYSHFQAVGPRFCYLKELDLLFMSYQNYVLAIDLGSKQIVWKKSLMPSGRINGIERLKDGLIYLITDKGVYSMNHEGAIVEWFLPDKNASDALIDREGNLWISTLNSGVFCIYNKAIVSFATQAKYCVLKNEQSFLFGGYDFEIHQIKRDRISQYPINVPTSLMNKNTLERITQLVKYSDNEILIGSNEGLYLLDKQDLYLVLKGVVKNLSVNKGQVYLSNQNFFMRLDEDVLQFGLKTYADNESTSRLFHRDIIMRSHFSMERVECFSNSINDRFYLSKFDGKVIRNDTLKQLDFEKSGQKIVNIKYTKEENLWLLGDKGKLFFYDHLKDRLLEVLDSAFAAKNQFTAMEIDGRGNLWLGSNKGIWYVEKEKERFRISIANTYTRQKDDIINEMLFDNDTLWLATSSGITRIPVKSLQDSVVPPLLYVDSIKVNQLVLDLEQPIEFSSDVDSVIINTTVVSFKGSEDLVVHYELMGDDTLSGVFDGRKLVLNDFSSGEYQLIIYANKSHGLENNYQQLFFSVKTVWWQSPYFWIALGLLLTSGIVLLRQKITKQIEKKIAVAAKEEEKYILVKSVVDQSELKIKLNELYYIRASGDYIEFIITGRKVVVRMTMKKALSELQSSEFIRVHNSYIVNIAKVRGFKSDQLQINGFNIPISRANRAKVKERYQDFQGLN